MNRFLATFALATGLVSASFAFAQAPAAAPAGSTGMCKDGSYTSNDTKKGACAGHKGVKDWFAVAAAAAPAMKPAAPVAATTTTKAAPAVPTAAPAMDKTATAAAKAPVAGGGPGQVWVNSASKVYHCSGTKYYGTTKAGEYMTEAAAKAGGNHADHGKACS